MRVRLVVTGDLEKAALGTSLEHVLRAAGADVTFEPPLLLSGCAMTTERLPDPADPDSRMRSPFRRMASALITEILVAPKRGASLPDLVLGIDDIELANIHQPGVVTAWLVRAINEVLAERYPSLAARDRARVALRERCSFHLLVPLAEAYFFGDPAALSRAGVPAGTPLHLVSADVEAFETNHPDFLAQAAVENAEKAATGRDWWREERHPKRYLDFLLACVGRIYSETQEGARALESLAWPDIAVQGGGAAVAFARALFEDLSDALTITSPLGAGAASPWTYPARTVRRGTLTLRNF